MVEEVVTHFQRALFGKQASGQSRAPVKSGVQGQASNPEGRPGKSAEVREIDWTKLKVRFSPGLARPLPTRDKGGRSQIDLLPHEQPGKRALNNLHELAA